MIKHLTFGLVLVLLALPAGLQAAGGTQGKGESPPSLLDPDEIPGGGGGGGGGGTPTGPQYRISAAVYEIARISPTLTQTGKFKIRGWTRFEQNIGGNWTKVDADWIEVYCFGSGINDQDDENNAGFVDVEDWSGAIVSTGGSYPVSCFHNARKSGTTYSAVSSTIVQISTPIF